MKVCIHKKTKEILETQFGNDSEVLLKNNLQSFLLEDLEIVDWTLEEYKINLEKQDEPIRRKREIIAKLNELDRQVIRPLLDGEIDKVEEIKKQKIILREELRRLGV